MIKSFDDEHLRAICDLLADTSAGLTNTELDQLLDSCGIEDPTRATKPPRNPYTYAVGPNKRTRLFDALHRQQQQDECGNIVGAFIQAAMKPVRYTQNPKLFDERRDGINIVLAFTGLQLGKDGILAPAAPASNLDQARERANRLRRALLDRGAAHPETVRYCAEEFFREDFFHAVEEATKGLFERIRQMTGLTSDGASLVDETFASSRRTPRLVFNTLRTDTEKSEHAGFMNMLKGVYSSYRTPQAHTPKVRRLIDEEEALDALSVISSLHRRLDQAISTGSPSQP